MVMLRCSDKLRKSPLFYIFQLEMNMDKTFIVSRQMSPLWPPGGGALGVVSLFTTPCALGQTQRCIVCPYISLGLKIFLRMPRWQLDYY